MRALPIVFVAFMLVAGCTSAGPYAKTPLRTESKTQAIPNGQFFLAPFGSNKDHPLHARAHVVVLSGGPIDVWFAPEDQCGHFGERTFAPLGSAFNTTDATVEADFGAPNATNTNCLILDNSPFAMGQAKPVGNVTVNYTIELWPRAS